jgi:type IV secretory pathway TrbF-like protein
MSSMNAVLNRTVSLPAEECASIYLDKEAAYIVHNRLLRVCIFAMAVAIICSGAAIYKLAMREPERIVVRVDPEGQAVVAPYASLDYRPREPEMQFFLINFIKDHYSRVRATYKDAFQRKLFFLDENLARAVMDQENKEKTIQNFLSSADDEIEVYVSKPSIEDMRQQPYRARIDFERVYLSPSDRHETKREKYTAQVQFSLLKKVPNRFVEVNPLGLVINYERVDQAFEVSK